MFESLGAIEEALAIVQKTLDLLTARGDNEAAFELAKVQYTVSIRDSWPANLGKLVGALERVASNAELKLNQEERLQVDKAIATFKAVSGP